ncbi:MAG: hemerythrin domain-containing protein [Gammaproteobacteria bacterium]|nr:hemerythrin domain-containing protein [Gammaproteobacteria bacterium]
MQRHPALRSFSNEHHRGLELARRARKAATQETSAQAAAWEAVRKIFRTELEPHFQREEQGLLPVLRVAGEIEKVDRTLREHRSMHFLVLEESADNLALFAESLTNMIRFEETELFDTAQSVLGCKVLDDLEQVLNNGVQVAE